MGGFGKTGSGAAVLGRKQEGDRAGHRSAPSEKQATFLPLPGQAALHCSRWVVSECEVVEGARGDDRVRICWETTRGSGAAATVTRTKRWVQTTRPPH
eukprot:scaffold274929_cov28-Tisochrysis_lutea.AAC.1